MLLEIPPLVGDLRFFFGDLLFLGGDLLFLQADAVLHLGDLALQHADLALNHRDLFLQLRFQRLGGLLLLFCIGQFLFVLYNGLGELIQLVLQAGHAGSRRGRVDRNAQQQAGRCQKQAGGAHGPAVPGGGFCVGGGIHEVQAEARRVFCLFHREGSFRLHIQMLADGEHAA